MDDLQSKVTRRPRSKLERVVDVLTSDYEVPKPPATTMVERLALHYLVSAGSTSEDASSVLRSMRTPGGDLDPRRLAAVPRDVVASLCDAGQVDEARAALHALGRLAESNAFDGLASLELDEARRALGALPRLDAEKVDYLLLSSRLFATVAPAPSARRVAVRLGYPGDAYPSIARALDAEIPEGDGVAVAWRTHHVLRRHGHEVCTPETPSCSACRVRGACSFRGEGDDPVRRLGREADEQGGSVSRVSSKPTS